MSEESSIQIFRLVIEGFALVLVGILGIVGNILTTIWFFRKKNNFYHLMSILALCDLLYIICSILIFGIPSIFQRVLPGSVYDHLVPVALPLAQIGMTSSIYFTLAIAVERYTTVCHPFYKVSSSWSSAGYILPIITFSVIYNIPKFFELQVKTVRRSGNNTLCEDFYMDEDEEDLGEYFGHCNDSSLVNSTLVEKVVATSLRVNPLYIKLYLIYLNLLIHGLIPFILLIILNIAIYKEIKVLGREESRLQNKVHHSDITLAQISLGIVAVFIGCHIVKWIPNIWELVNIGDNPQELVWPAWLNYVTCLSHLLTTFNCSVNFFIYYFKHKKKKQHMQLHNGSTDILHTDMTELGCASGFRTSIVTCNPGGDRESFIHSPIN